MGKILFIGVTCVDVVINVDRLPKTAEDVVVFGQQMTLGGCAFNAFWAARAAGADAVLLSPVGGGAYGDFVRSNLAAEGVTSLFDRAPGENGCCYCFVEPGGERTFIAYHGADYVHRAEWYEGLDLDGVDAVYVCGLEVEEPTGGVIVDFLERRCAPAGVRIFFTPGPRPCELPRDLLARILDLRPVLHMNDAEACMLASQECDLDEEDLDGEPLGVGQAARALFDRTGSLVTVTLGADGCWYEDGRRRGAVPGVPAQVVDTIGAGDAHIGAAMARLVRGDSLEDALACANRVASAVVSHAGAHVETLSSCLGVTEGPSE